ncbi:hypothetical protein MYX84_00170 [Acidobacteria bacterium AH-259-O06]|nr:hypothetical protein [Acidobacteria bacterium AH-259-O06]
MITGVQQNQTNAQSSLESRGVTLVEALVATVVLLLVAGAIVSILFQSQKSYADQHDLIEASEIARAAMNQIQSFLRQAGNDPENIGFTPITLDNPNQITIYSDVTGSVSEGPQAKGEPDAKLTSRYEQVSIRYNPPPNKQLFINVNAYDATSSEELLAENIADFDLEYYDLQGNTTTDGNKIARVHIKVVAETGSADLQTGNVKAITLESAVMIRSHSYQMFQSQ